ncbi:MAG: methyltransferase domain-containing protein [Verrucomicrobia bacterium]|nr:MAG: methyltransferase domain-containing protein [Verrucomicrobiota bacterium]
MDRYYIERFLAKHARDIRGHVLEVGDLRYTRQFGGGQVERTDVLHVSAEDPHATIVGDLAAPGGIGEGLADCFIATQTLQFIYDVRAAVANIHRALRPGGVALITVPCISQIATYDMERWGEYWRFTHMALERLFGDVFGEDRIEVDAFGNVLAAVAFMHGLVIGEVSAEELNHFDPRYELLLGVRAVKG